MSKHIQELCRQYLEGMLAEEEFMQKLGLCIAEGEGLSSSLPLRQREIMWLVESLTGGE